MKKFTAFAVPVLLGGGFLALFSGSDTLAIILGVIAGTVLALYKGLK